MVLTLKQLNLVYTFCAFYRNCVEQDNFFYFLVSLCPFIVDNNTFLLCVPNEKIWKIANFSATLLEKNHPSHNKKNHCTEIALNMG